MGLEFGHPDTAFKVRNYTLQITAKRLNFNPAQPPPTVLNQIRLVCTLSKKLNHEKLKKKTQPNFALKLNVLQVFLY